MVPFITTSGRQWYVEWIEITLKIKISIRQIWLINIKSCQKNIIESHEQQKKAT